ncbi:MAG: hypothetical protein OXP73_00230 [Chloroflexota bacterium]|nr:hypothetical protein [Chloroflexota bacterium]
MGEIATLRRLDLSFSGLSGMIPPKLGQRAELRVVKLANNRLTGCLPAGLRPTVEGDLGKLRLPWCAAA